MSSAAKPTRAPEAISAAPARRSFDLGRGTLGAIVFVLVLAAVPLGAPQFWVTLGNYIGL